MSKRKVLKWVLVILLLIVGICFLRAFTLQQLWEFVREFNLKISENNPIGTFITYWIEIVVTLTIWDILMFDLSADIRILFEEISKYLIKKKSARWSILFIRANYSFNKLMYFLRLGWIRSSFRYDDKIVWNSIIRAPVKDIIVGIGLSLVRLPGLIAMFFTAISLKWFNINEMQNIWNGFCNLEFNFGEVAKMLSPFMMVLLVIFIWYFVSFKGTIRRAIAQANRKKIEDIIQKHRELSETIGDCLYTIATNLQYVINCQKLVADLWIHSKFPNYKDKDCLFRGDRNVEDYCFKEILELEKISQIFDELNTYGNQGLSRTFSSYKYEFLAVMIRHELSSVERLNKIFFTKEGMNMIVTDAKQPKTEYSKDKIKEIYENYLNGIPNKIVDSLELLYKFCRYYNEMNKLLNIKSDKVGRILRMFTGKE